MLLQAVNSLERADHSSRGVLPSLCAHVPFSMIKGNDKFYTYSEQVDKGQGKKRRKQIL